MLRFAILTVVGTFGQFNDPVVVNGEIIRRLDNYDKASFWYKLIELLQAACLVLKISFRKLLEENQKSFGQSFERHYQYLCELNFAYEPRRYEIYYGNVSNTISRFFQ